MYNLRSWRAPAPLSTWWRSLVFYWHTRDKGHFYFFAALAIPSAALAVAIHHFVAVKHHNEETRCLALNVYHESRGEPVAGQYAVAEVTLNRVASKHYPDSVCKVVYQKNWDYMRGRYVSAFSWTELDETSMPRGKAWQRAWETAVAVYGNERAPTVGEALFYHSRGIKPSWARSKKPVARIGRHIFYE
jgi:spore germination cell wall hydrolase CwlJ-like protein